MPRIRCHYANCVYLEAGFCGATSVEIDPDEGCMTFTHVADVSPDEAWSEEDLGEIWEDEEEAYAAEGDDDDEDLWLEEDEPEA